MGAKNASTHIPIRGHGGEASRTGQERLGTHKREVRFGPRIVERSHAVLWMFVRTRAQFDHELLPFPVDVLGRLANIAEELSDGIVPALVADARKGGRPYRLRERRYIAYAVLYILAVKRGEI